MQLPFVAFTQSQITSVIDQLLLRERLCSFALPLPPSEVSLMLEHDKCLDGRRSEAEQNGS